MKLTYLAERAKTPIGPMEDLMRRGEYLEAPETIGCDSFESIIVYRGMTIENTRMYKDG